MAIQNRRGAYTNFDPTKLKPGEFAVVQSGDPDGNQGYAIYMCFSSGVVKRMIAAEDLANALAEFEVAWEDVSGRPVVDTTLSVPGAIPDSSIVGARLAQKQNTLTFDTAPTAGSTNPVTSSGIKQAIDAHTVAVDATLTQQGTAADAKAVGDALAVVDGNFATSFASKVYEAGSYVIYNHKLYTNPERLYYPSSFNPNDWTEIKVSRILGLSQQCLADSFFSGDLYDVGDFCIYKGLLYKCIVAHSGAWNDSHFERAYLADEVNTKSSVTVDANGVMHF